MFFFFQAEDGIRDKLVTGVQTCALPISPYPAERAHHSAATPRCPPGGLAVLRRAVPGAGAQDLPRLRPGARDRDRQGRGRSEEHTSELQSLAYLVCRLLLEKKKKHKTSIKVSRQ